MFGLDVDIQSEDCIMKASNSTSSDSILPGSDNRKEHNP